MSTGCYMQTMNRGTLHQKLIKCCMVTNITVKKKKLLVLFKVTYALLFNVSIIITPKFP